MDDNDKVYAIMLCLNMSSLGSMSSIENNRECFNKE